MPSRASPATRASAGCHVGSAYHGFTDHGSTILVFTMAQLTTALLTRPCWKCRLGCATALGHTHPVLLGMLWECYGNASSKGSWPRHAAHATPRHATHSRRGSCTAAQEPQRQISLITARLRHGNTLPQSLISARLRRDSFPNGSTLKYVVTVVP